MSNKLFRLDAGYQQYDWGKIGSSSAVAQFAAHSGPPLFKLNKINHMQSYGWVPTARCLPTTMSLRNP
ncbi:CRE_collapsed_G0029400.mRNA.1.CDS.1 [Saccharomyces cerevisiae]|nr:CRE_collapsed_G0029400.mRNA.1.CDS.1 [Saccharomyces cerevisiae]